MPTLSQITTNTTSGKRVVSCSRCSISTRAVVAKGLVRRQRGRADRRATLLRLTPAGEQAARRLARWGHGLEAALAGLSPDERAARERGLGAIVGGPARGRAPAGRGAVPRLRLLPARRRARPPRAAPVRAARAVPVRGGGAPGLPAAHPARLPGAPPPARARRPVSRARRHAQGARAPAQPGPGARRARARRRSRRGGIRPQAGIERVPRRRPGRERGLQAATQRPGVAGRWPPGWSAWPAGASRNSIVSRRVRATTRPRRST
jgi:hypothetical protein